MEYVHPALRAMGSTQEPYGLALHEIAHAHELGHDVTSLRERLATIAPDDTDRLLALYADVPRTPPADSPSFEGSDLATIEANLSAATGARPVTDVADRVAGAWYGRIAGNMLGKPVEWQWPRGELESYLRARDAWPLDDYVPIDPDLRVDLAGAAGSLGRAHGFYVFEGVGRGEIAGGVRDDDIDFTVLGLHLLERRGPGYTSYDVAHEWLTGFPLNALYTAERAAYNNLVRDVPLDEAGLHHNPFREWIGALIRADVHGYVYAGDPRRAARSVHPDAWLSHRSVGIHGAMWAAALIASAFTAPSPEASVAESLEHVPAASRLAAGIGAVLADFRSGRTWERAMDGVEARTAGMDPGHVLNNAAALTAALLWGDGDFSATIALAVLSGLDTDSIGATASSWAGAFAGLGAIPARWTEPLRDRTTCALFGHGEVRISDLVDRTLRLRTASESPALRT